MSCSDFCLVAELNSRSQHARAQSSDMSDPQPSRRSQTSDETLNPRSVAVTVIAAALGAIAGAMAASQLPSDKFAWTGFALAPLFVLLELLLKQFAVVFGGDRNA